MSLTPSWPSRWASCWSRKWPSPPTASAPRGQGRGRRAWRTAAWRCWRTSASTPARRRTTPTSPRPWPPTATSTSTTPSAPPTAPTPRPRAWPASCRPIRAWPCSASWRPWTRRWAIRRSPVLGIVGGSKVSTKLDLLNNLVAKLDRLAIGGGMANTFLFAQGHDVGGSLCEKDLADTAREIIDDGREVGLRTAAAGRRGGGQEGRPRRRRRDPRAQRRPGRRPDPGRRPQERAAAYRSHGRRAIR